MSNSRPKTAPSNGYLGQVPGLSWSPQQRWCSGLVSLAHAGMQNPPCMHCLFERSWAVSAERLRLERDCESSVTREHVHIQRACEDVTNLPNTHTTT